MRSRFIWSLSMALGFGVFLGGDAKVARAQNVVRLGNITYEYVPASVTWAEAEYRARQRILAGTTKRGTLAVLESDQQQKFILDKFGSRNDFFLGATRASDGNFYWLTGRRVVTKYWAPGEPNNFKGKESALEIRRNLGLNDISPNATRSYVVEYR